MGGVQRILNYQFDLDGNRTRVTHPDGYFFQYGFDGLNRMNALAESATPSPASSTVSLLTIDYWNTGSRKTITRPGGATTSIVPDNALRLASFTQDLASTANDLTNSFTYNPASQVKTLTQSNTQYNYTQAQNRVGGYGVNGLNQYTQIDGEALQHNANGNLTQDRAPDGQLIQYTYDMENHLVAAAGPVASTLTYDTLGRLSRLTLPGGTTQFLYDGDALVAEYLDGTLTRRYVHGDQVDEPLVQYNGTNLATRRYLHADHQGSVIAHSDGTGAATQKNAYDPYGIPASSNSGRFGYTGQTWIPELGLNYYKARIYSPRLGRFLQTDPIFYEDDMNMYAYVGNDPLNGVDPTGLFVISNCVYEGGGKYVCGASSSSEDSFFSRKKSPQSESPIENDSGTSDPESPVQDVDAETQGDTISEGMKAAIARGDVQRLKTLAEAASPDQTTLINVAIKRLESKASEVISKELKGSVNQAFPAHLRDKAVHEIYSLARSGDKAAQTARKLLTDNRFKKGS